MYFFISTTCTYLNNIFLLGFLALGILLLQVTTHQIQTLHQTIRVHPLLQAEHRDRRDEGQASDRQQRGPLGKRHVCTAFWLISKCSIYGISARICCPYLQQAPTPAD